MTAEEFAESLAELPDRGRWVELVGGQLHTLDPPDVAHGTTVLNLSKALASHLQPAEGSRAGYACFDLGLVVSRDPDTVHFPAISFFPEGRRFLHTDHRLTDVAPALVVEIAATSSRRHGLAGRVELYHSSGVEVVWVIDPVDRQVHVLRHGCGPQTLASEDSLDGEPVLCGFRMRVGELFAEPPWW
jgi:Uma2 family endonuclease